MFHITKHTFHLKKRTYKIVDKIISGILLKVIVTDVQKNAIYNNKSKKIGGQVQDAMRCISCVTSVMMMSYYCIILMMSIDSVKRKVIISTTGKRNCWEVNYQIKQSIRKRQQKYKYVTSPVQLVIYEYHAMPYFAANSYLL